ncbi:hypothetical protein AX14_003622 [Amanita brunnescens Koide BX004]|nr:hypothetical protein AX14_003622 [Amanita brunnescens Koide BX004]
MSDQARQSVTDKVGAAVKPDSEKSLMEQVGDKSKGMADSVASTLQPNVRLARPSSVVRFSLSSRSLENPPLSK